MSPVLEAKTLNDLLTSIRRTAYRLEQLETFQDVQVSLDTSKDPFASPESIDVHVFVKEAPKARAKTGTELGNSEGSAYASIHLSNVFGGAEKFEANFAKGTRTSSAFTASMTTPINADPERIASISAYQSVRSSIPTSSFEETVRGTSFRYRFPMRWGTHELGYEASWRKIRVEDILSRFSLLGQDTTASMSVRHHAGHSLKSAVSHTFSRDTRNDPLLPSTGHYFRIFQECAGLGGDVDYIKHEFEAQAATSPIRKIALTGTLRGGLLIPTSGTQSRINDRFFIGGPSSVRGFRYSGLGPRDRGDALGGDVYYAAGLSLMTCLPKVPNSWPLFGHVWLNAGSLLPLDRSKPAIQTLQELVRTPSIATGLGLVYRHSVVRLELNLCVPLAAVEGEISKKGVQFGLGISFL